MSGWARTITAADRDEMVRLYGAGLSTHQIASRVDRNRGVVYRALVKAGVTMRPPGMGQYPDEFKAEAVARVGAGEAPWAVGNDLGIDSKQLRVWADRAGVEVHTANYQRARRAADTYIRRKYYPEWRAKFDEERNKQEDEES